MTGERGCQVEGRLEIELCSGGPGGLGNSPIPGRGRFRFLAFKVAFSFPDYLIGQRRLR
jgi:hypothetical protein